MTVQRLDGAWRPVPGTGRRIPCDALAVGHGLVPQLELATALGCAVRRTADGTVALALDTRRRTSVPGIWSAGETGGVGGVEPALLEGRLAGHDVAYELHGRRLPPPTRVLARRLARRRAFADTMAAAHRPGPGWVEWLTPDTVVCRCEEVSVAEVREAVETLGALDSRAVKLLTRAGMGWCQGRMCGSAVAALAGREEAPESRPLSCPVLLGNLAQLPGTDVPGSGDPGG
ncbi:(2Fe-2S)-binding protein [Streptomyces sp. NPDC051098]|uniref:(2Fe-2S)-binding protein n=1 Tax=Streptomyces sp. NPDC051098 TaxID=3155411 RepID=UPI003440036B